MGRAATMGLAFGVGGVCLLQRRAQLRRLRLGAVQQPPARRGAAPHRHTLLERRGLQREGRGMGTYGEGHVHMRLKGGMWEGG